MSKNKLRIGLLLDSYTVEAWEHKIIRTLMDCDYADIQLVILNDIEHVNSDRSVISNIKGNQDQIVYVVIRKLLDSIYRKFIERGGYLPDASRSMDSSSILKNITTIKVRPIKRKWSDYFSDYDVTAIKESDIDILIRFGFRILRSEILSAARYGIWSYHHGDNRINRGGPAGFWESMESWSEVGSILQILTEDLNNGKVLYKSFSCVNKISIQDNISNYYWKSSSFITRKIKELYSSNKNEFLEKVASDNRHPIFYSDRLYVKPSNLQYSKLILKKIIEKFILSVNYKIYFNQWILMFDLNDDFSSSLWRYKKIIPPKDRCWADPHVIKKDSIYYIFVEEMEYSTRKAHISVIIMDEYGNFEKPVTVLKRPYHISYPFVFEYKQEYYMIPDSLSNKTVELYKCIEFPFKWEYQKNIFSDIEATDSTVFFHKKKWWLFANIVEVEGASSWDELHLFSSDDPTSPDWQAHPKNPVVSDCKTARPAGKLFFHNGALYRPSQNCSVRYGYGFNISEITTLDEKNYNEKLVSAIKPKWDKKIIATHTFNRVDSLHIIDALQKRLRYRILEFFSNGLNWPAK